MPNGRRKTRVAVIGAGNMGRYHLRNYFMLPQTDLVGLADVNPNAEALATEYATAFYADYKTMLDELRPDAVSVVVPTPLHAPIVTDVLSRGIHCIVEKPVAASVNEADALIALAKEKGVVFTVGHIEHYNPLITKITELIEGGSVGEVTSVVCKRVGGFPNVEPKTDVVIDLAVHDIGIISHLLKVQPAKITSHVSRTHHSREVDAAEILLDYGKASGFIQANWLTPVKIRTIAVTGSEGYIEGNYVTQELELYRHKIVKKKDESGFTGFVMEMRTQEKELIKVDFEEPLAKELKTFIAHCNGDTDMPMVTPEEARDALALALEAVRGNTAAKEVA